MIFHGKMTRVKQSQIEQIQIGTTTREEIIKLLGKPQQFMYKPDGSEALVYMIGVERSFAIPFLLTIGRAGGSSQIFKVILKDGVVVDYELTTDDRGIIP